MSIPIPGVTLWVRAGVVVPIVVQNSGVVAGQPFKAAVNLGVTPVPGSIATAPTATGISVGVSPSAAAIDEADGIAVVANSGSNNDFADQPGHASSTVGACDRGGDEPNKRSRGRSAARRRGAGGK